MCLLFTYEISTQNKISMTNNNGMINKKNLFMEFFESLKECMLF